MVSGTWSFPAGTLGLCSLVLSVSRGIYHSQAVAGRGGGHAVGLSC